ncbi:LmeA family phospholipid-binding protein [Corynebacterium capitovis]|uniref:LmeA family phospholipid-binding protein n=1 Tax=Corynebacterium capitovis TaxID=131081 RepID=UPI00039CCF8F|nr:DUF2993 domain-containing protein [Corynebacterium capitovis]
MTTAVVLGVLIALLLADTVLASRIEGKISRSAYVGDALAYPPDAYVAGFPFSLALLTGTVPRVSVSTLDAPVEGLGVVNATAEAFEISTTPAHILRADFTGDEALAVRRTIRLDGVAFGELLGMTDLDISNPYDISPAGGPASEAHLTGTVPGTSAPSTVVVTLRMEGPTFVMKPSILLDAPAGAEDAVLSAFTLERDTRDLPLGGPAGLVQVSGGSIEFSRDRINVTLGADDLTPLAPVTATQG